MNKSAFQRRGGRVSCGMGLKRLQLFEPHHEYINSGVENKVN